jgi:SsrA-binding protein
MEDLAQNKKAYFDYEILDKFEAGLKLLGWEVKAIRSGKVSLISSMAIVRGGEVFVIGLKIQPYQNQPDQIDVGERTIKALLKHKEIQHLEDRLSLKGLTLVPLRLYNNDRKLKIELGLARGKKEFDKREKIKKRETDRNLRRLALR